MTNNNQNPGPISSVLDNRATFLQFLQADKNKIPTKKSAFTTVQYRKLNLTFATALENSIHSDHPTVQNTISALRSCSSNSLLKITENGTELQQTSKKCRNKYCSICSRIKSVKIAERLVRFLKEKEEEYDREQQRAYFLTLTLKHDKQTRKGVYVSELKDYIYKLFRSTLFKKHFGSDTETILAGQFRNMESTFSADSNHIHSHALILAPKIKVRAKELEQKLQQKWLKLTKDSHQARFDLIRNKEINGLKKSKKLTLNSLFPAIKEVVKYSVKISAKKNELPVIIDNIAEFLIKTKGTNFLTTSGALRGHALTSWKSNYDQEWNPKEHDPEATYCVARTSQIHFNKEHKFYTSRRKNKKDFEGQIINNIKGDLIYIDSAEFNTKRAMELSINENYLPDHFKFIAEKEGIPINSKKAIAKDNKTSQLEQRMKAEAKKNAEEEELYQKIWNNTLFQGF